ncbi:MAG TPA: DGQHR domain-containing protein [Candidatus Binatia bacterium]|jgi:DGQHR domain-containing protein|nr:DGQHR domain-containing protein [Candidatus Binatia bacterium]
MKKSGITKISALPVNQPIGEFYVGVIDARDLLDIAYADIREIERDLDNYLGIQRKLSPTRVKELCEYVNTKDATFPTSIILAIEEQCVEWNETKHLLTVHSTDEIEYGRVAKILDGQHRVEGLKALRENVAFNINVTIFVDADIADQANIFATVNLAQTKVNRSLVYDLFDYAKSRSPQKTSHDVAVALDRAKGGPFYQRIKRLGTRTIGRTGETLTQATVVTCLLEMISPNAMVDRDQLLRGKKLKHAEGRKLQDYPFRNLFIDEQDLDIAKIVSNYFEAVKQKWPIAWEDRAKGNILARTNGFRAFVRVLKLLYVDICGLERIGRSVGISEFAGRLAKVRLGDTDFNTQKYVPGSSGETTLYNDLIAFLRLDRVK